MARIFRIGYLELKKLDQSGVPFSSGGGPQREGLDAHNDYGKEQVYPGGNFDYHLIPFKAAIQAGAATARGRSPVVL